MYVFKRHIFGNETLIGCTTTDLENFDGDLHVLVMLWGADGWGGGRCPSHAMLNELQCCILLLPLLPLTLLLLLQLVSHQLDTQSHTHTASRVNCGFWLWAFFQK